MPDVFLAILIGIAAVIIAAVVCTALFALIQVVMGLVYDSIDRSHAAKLQKRLAEMREHDERNKARIHAIDQAVGELTSVMLAAMQEYHLRFNQLPDGKARFKYIVGVTGITAHPEYLLRAYKSAYNLHAQRTIKKIHGKGQKFTPVPDKSLAAILAEV